MRRLCQSFVALTLLSLSLFVSAEESAQSAATTIDTEGLKPGCFYSREVNNWDELNREYLIVYAPSKNRAYLVNIAPPSMELRGAATIGFAGRDQICGKAGERLVVGRGPAVGRDSSVMNVWRLPAEQVEKMLENKKLRESPKVEPAAESPGAEIETDVQPDRPSGNDVGS